MSGLLTRLRALAQFPWPVVFREFLTDRYATAGSLRLQVWDWRRSPTRNPDGLVQTTADALERLSKAGQGFGELVTSHLSFVIAVAAPNRTVHISPRAYVNAFEGPIATNGHLLAARLVWAATAIRLGHNAKASGRTLDVAGTKRACQEAQQRFLAQFDNADEWMDYFEPGGSDA